MFRLNETINQGSPVRAQLNGDFSTSSINIVASAGWYRNGMQSGRRDFIVNVGEQQFTRGGVKDGPGDGVFSV